MGVSPPWVPSRLTWYSQTLPCGTLRRTWRAWMKLLLKNVITTRTSLHKLTGKIKIRFNATNKISVVSFYPSSTHDEQFLHWDGRNNAAVVPNMASTGQYGAILKRKHTPISPPGRILRLYKGAIDCFHFKWTPQYICMCVTAHRRAN